MTGPDGGWRERLSLALFLGALAAGIFAYGVVVGRYEVFPFRILREAQRTVSMALGQIAEGSWYYREIRDPTLGHLHDPERAWPGLNLVTRVGREKRPWIEIVDMAGEVVHAWEADWDRLWPDPAHLLEEELPGPRDPPYPHGAVILGDGDVVFNFEHKGLMRLDRTGEPVWRLPYRTHHSVEVGPDGNLWVSGQRRVERADPRFPDREPPFDEYTLLEVSPEGELLRERSIAELLYRNGYGPLVHAGAFVSRDHPTLLDDRLHLNDVEPFPDDITPGFFGPGDLAVSLRNVNVVFVVELASETIKFLGTGAFARPHDPDFVAGDTLSIYDNLAVGADRSRIVKVHAPGNEVTVAYEADDGIFFSHILGKHQRLPNGNLLITESRAGRAFEVTPEGEIVWQYVNEVEPGVVGVLTEVSRLSPEVGAIFRRAPRDGSR